MSVSPHEGSGAASGLIIPDNIPGDDLNPSKLEEAAGTLRTAGTSSLAQATVAEDTWAGLPSVLESPQGPTIYAALGTPSEAARTIERKFYRVSDALDDFAAALRPIKTTFSQIKTDAVAFRATIRWDEKVWMAPSETQEYEGNGLATVSTTSYSTSYSTGSSLEDVVAYLKGRGESTRVSGGRVQILAHWTQSSEHIDKNNALMDRLADAYTKLQNAEADCANAINRQRDLCMVDVEYIEAWQLKQSGESTVVLPWGSRVDEERNCGESFWWGAGNAGKEALEGAGTLIGRDPLSGEFSWEMAGKGWLGALQGIGSLVIMTFPPSYLLGQLGVPVFKEASELVTGMGKGLLAWDTWAENPSEAAGRVLVNVGSLFIPGAGEAAAVIKAMSAGSRIVNLAGDAASLTDNVLSGADRLADMTAKLDGMSFDALGALRLDELVPAGGRFDLPDSDVLHVGLKNTDSPAPPVSLLDDSAPGTKVGDGPAPAHPTTPRVDSDSGPSGTGHGDGGPQAPSGSAGDGAPPHAPDGDGQPGPASGGDTPPPRSDFADPPAHAGPEGARPSSVDWKAIDDEYRLPNNAVDPARFDEWANKVSEAYPTLTPDDVKAVYNYTTNNGYNMNEYLRHGTIDEGVTPTASQVASLEAQITAATNALAKLPAEPGYSFRGVGMTDDFLGQFEVGKPWTDAGFSSSSTDFGVAQRFAGEASGGDKVPGIIEVRGLTGSGVTPIGRYSNEAELLFQRSTPYEVLAKYQDDKGVWRITLRELPR